MFGCITFPVLITLHHNISLLEDLPHHSGDEKHVKPLVMRSQQRWHQSYDPLRNVLYSLRSPTCEMFLLDWQRETCWNFNCGYGLGKDNCENVKSRKSDKVGEALWKRSEVWFVPWTYSGWWSFKCWTERCDLLCFPFQMFDCGEAWEGSRGWGGERRGGRRGKGRRREEGDRDCWKEFKKTLTSPPSPWWS